MESIQNGITHGFIVEFANEEDRTYYINTDPSHRKFVADIGAVVEKAQVVDFAPGAF